MTLNRLNDTKKTIQKRDNVSKW